MSLTRTAAVLAAAYLIGSLPLGAALLRQRGQRARLLSPHNVGVSNVAQAAGPQTLAQASLLDAGKGAAGALLGGLPGVAAAYSGHLYPNPAVSAALHPEPLPRGRGLALLAGGLLGLAALSPGQKRGRAPQTAGVLAAWAAGALGTRYGVLGTAAAAAAFVLLERDDRASATLLAASVLWRHKENLARVLDGTEPRIGEPVPMAGRRKDEVLAAFMIHPMNLEDFWGAGRFRPLKPLVDAGVLPREWVLWAARFMRPMKVGELHGMRASDGTFIRTYLLSSPLLPEVFKNEPELATRRAIQGARLAQELGASVFGLGAFWSVVGDKGQDVQKAVPDITVTNGGAYTSGTIKAAIPGILRHFQETGRDLKAATAAVVGAGGVVAFGIARTVAPEVAKVIMVGRNLERLERSAETLRRANPGTTVLTTTDMADIREAELVFSATSDPNPVIFPEHVRPGAWIFDEGRPADVHDSVRAVPGVRVIPGGVVRPPGEMTSAIDLQFGPGAVPACLAETLIIAATGEHDRKSLGIRTKTENVNFFVEKAEELGFTVLEE